MQICATYPHALAHTSASWQKPFSYKHIAFYSSSLSTKVIRAGNRLFTKRKEKMEKTHLTQRTQTTAFGKQDCLVTWYNLLPPICSLQADHLPNLLTVATVTFHWGMLKQVYRATDPQDAVWGLSWTRTFSKSNSCYALRRAWKKMPWTLLCTASTD